MNNRRSLLTAALLTVVVLAGAGTIAVALDQLGRAGNDEVGTLSTLDLANNTSPGSTTSTVQTVPMTPQTIDVYVQDGAPAPAPGSESVAPPAVGVTGSTDVTGPAASPYGADADVSYQEDDDAGDDSRHEESDDDSHEGRDDDD